jgi:hypothetical protein
MRSNAFALKSSACRGRRAGVHRVRLRVIGPDGAEVARYDDLASIPAEVEDDFGHRVYVTPDKVEVIFEVTR